MSANVLARIDNQISEINPESVRCKALVSLRDFRSSWVKLGQYLTDIAYGGDYKEWGYEDFEVYCASELGLKKPTVKKLMVSYNYMKSYEPDLLEQGSTGEAKCLVDCDTIEQLKKARERDDIKEEEKEELHRMAFESGVDQKVIRKEIKERIMPKQMFEDVEKANLYRRKEIQVIMKSARNLRKRLFEAKSVPEGVKNRVEDVLCELEALE